MDGDVYIKGGAIRFGALTVSGGTVTIIPPKRNWREEISGYLRLAILSDRAFQASKDIGKGIWDGIADLFRDGLFSKVRLRGAKPHAAAYPSTS